jgi:hypothetical protein
MIMFSGCPMAGGLAMPSTATYIPNTGHFWLFDHMGEMMDTLCINSVKGDE